MSQSIPAKINRLDVPLPEACLPRSSSKNPPLRLRHHPLHLDTALTPSQPTPSCSQSTCVLYQAPPSPAGSPFPSTPSTYPPTALPHPQIRGRTPPSKSNSASLGLPRTIGGGTATTVGVYLHHGLYCLIWSFCLGMTTRLGRVLRPCRSRAAV